MADDWDRFARLGDMIGEGQHHEEKWILKEYKALQKILLKDSPEVKEYKTKIRKLKNEKINKIIKHNLKNHKCTCGSTLEQTRSGSKVVKCKSCPKKYKYQFN